MRPKVIHTASIVCVNITLCPLGVVVDCFHCFVILCCFFFPSVLADNIICERCGRFLGNYCVNAHCIRVGYHHLHIIVANNVNSVGRENFKKFSVVCYYLLHCCLVFDYGYKVTTFFLNSKFFFNFFYTFFQSMRKYIYICRWPVFLPFPVVSWSCVRWSPEDYLHTIIRAYIRAHTYAHGDF